MDEADLRRAAVGLRHSRRAGWLFLLGLGCYVLLPSPWMLLASAFGVFAMVDQVRAFRAYGVVRGSGTLRAMALVSAFACASLAAMTAIPVALDLAHPAQRTCRHGANTAAAREECDRRFGKLPGAPYLTP